MQLIQILNKDCAKKNVLLINHDKFNQKTHLPKQPPEVFYKKGVLNNFVKFTGKQQCQSLFFNKVAGLRLY